MSRALLVILAALLTACNPLTMATSNTDAPITIAFVKADASGSDTEGKNIKGVRLYIEEVNRKGGINGRMLQVKQWNDLEDPEQAVKMAHALVADNQAMAVIGHEYSSSSIAAGPIYADAQIPVITYSATNNAVTLDNDWFFRTIFNDGSQGSYLANFVIDTLEQQRVTIVHETKTYGAFLAQVFGDSIAKLGGVVDRRLAIETKGDVHARVAEVAEAILTRGDQAGLIFLALHAKEAVLLVRQLRDAGLKNQMMGPDAVASADFINGFRDLPKERRKPGFYSEGIYITSPINFDASDEEAQTFQKRYLDRFGEMPDWKAAYSYDTAKLIVEAMRNSGVAGDPKQISNDRRAIRDYLASINSLDLAIKGVTGLNYFDEQGDMDKPVSIAQYHDNTPVSSMVHYSVIPDIDEIYNLQQEIDKGHISLINDRYMYKKHIIYSGVRLHAVGPYSEKRGIIRLDFTIWFRFRGDFAPENIEFQNAIDTVALTEPVKEISEAGMNYRAYRVEAEFRSNFIPSRVSLGEHIIGFRFRNSELNRNKIIYINDIVGMGLTGIASVADKMSHNTKFIQLDNWSITDAAIFENNLDIDGMGNPGLIRARTQTLPFSQYSLVIHLQKNAMSVRGSLPTHLSGLIAIASMCAILLLLLLRRLNRLTRFKALLWVFEGISVVFLLISIEMWLIDNYLIDQGTHIQELAITIINIFWWLLPAIIINDAINLFVWQPLQHSTGRSVPNVVRDIVAVLIYILAFFGVVSFVFDQKLTGLLATSGLIAMIIGLAIQVNLSNIFSGIALNIEHPFRVGDWVHIGEHIGKVVDVNWRATRIETDTRNLISIPNSPVANSPIINYSAHGYGRLSLIVGLHPSHPIGEVKRQLLNAVLSHAKILLKPEPRIIYKGIDRGVCRYLVAYSIADFGSGNLITEEIWIRIFERLRDAGITFVGEQSRVEVNQPIPEAISAPDEQLVLKKVAEFADCPEEFYRQFSELAQIVNYRPGDRFIQQGQSGTTMYVIVDGVVGIFVQNPAEGSEIEVGRLSSGDILGGHSLLNTSPRTASAEAITSLTLFKCEREQIIGLLELYPNVLERLQAQDNQHREVNKKKVEEHKTQKRSESNLFLRIFKST